MSNQEQMKKYREHEYDESEKEYATTVQKSFTWVNAELQKKFNQFTEDLMTEPAIKRHLLLEALRDFKRSDLYTEKSSIYTTMNNYNAFVEFECTAFNCRPWQPCTIS